MVKDKIADMLDAMAEAMTAKARTEGLSRTIFHKHRITIKCSQCKGSREIYSQDKHQVKLCRDCQRRMRNARPKKKRRPTPNERVARRSKKRKLKRPEPAIPTFADRSPRSPDDKILNL